MKQTKQRQWNKLINSELEKTENLQKRLTTLQLKFDLGDISEEDFTAQEQEILEAMEAEMDEQEE